ncbi:MAG: copper homeostasis protein CutC [Bacteroidales bacterium]|nr:copper homeostasis protein CutC [Bacteroidales bacterium]
MMQSSKKYMLEICAASVASAISAERGGADRVELISSLSEGGVTPGAATIRLARKNISIGLFVIIRPRAGDFCYSGPEFEVMKEDIKTAKDLGADGMVSGILLPDGSVDIKRTSELVQLTKPLEFSFHRAFDMTSDPFEALNDIISSGADRMLTSGQKNKALEGVELIRQLVEKAGDRIIIMAGSGISEENIRELALKTGAQEFHATLRGMVDSRMKFRNPAIKMGGMPGIPEYGHSETDENRVRKVAEILHELKG